MAIDPKIVEGIIRDWKAVSYGNKRKIVESWAVALNLSPKTIYGVLPTKRKRKKGKRKIEGIEAYVRTVFMIKKKPPEQLGEITTEQALRIAILDGLVPENMAGRASTFDRIGREIGLTKKQRRIQRFQAEYPNQLHHVDASSSKHFYIKRQLENGDYVLGLHAGMKGYKNKPVPIRLRLWVYGVTDDHSGVWAARYVVAYGETAIDNIRFLNWAWQDNGDKDFCGAPDRIKGDLGPMMRGPAMRDFLERAGIIIDPSEPGNKDAHGKIERKWRVIWKSFELLFFACLDYLV